MDFQSVNSLNVRLNMLSGNLLPMTSGNSLFSTAWRIYSAIIWLIQIILAGTVIPAIVLIPKDKALQNGGTVSLILSLEVFILFSRIHSYRDLVSQLIQKLNDILRSEDEIMRNIVRSTMKPIETPLEFYWMAGTGSLVVWCSIPLTLVFKKNYFFYEDYGIPVAFSRQPFSTEIFVLGNLIVSIASVYLFIKKVALDVYMINLVLLMTAQYRYSAIKLAIIFSKETRKNVEEEFYLKMDSQAEKEMKALCRHHNSVIYITSMLKKLLSLNVSLLYVTNVMRFCFLGIMLISAILLTAPLEAFMIVMYMSGGLVQLYILCLCIHQLLDASTNVTDKAFHEKWYHCGPSLKRMFMLMIISNNLEYKMSMFEKFNLTLPSFMTILNQSYSIALLFLRVK